VTIKNGMITKPSGRVHFYKTTVSQGIPCELGWKLELIATDRWRKESRK